MLLQGIGFRRLGFSVQGSGVLVPIIENRIEKKTNMKWKLGLFSSIIT